MLKKNLFVQYLKKIGLSKSAVRQYSDYYLEEESLKKLAKNLYNVGSIYEITSYAVISALYEKTKSLPVNKKWNNGLTAALKKYGEFIKTTSSSDFFGGCSTKWGVQVIQKIFFGAPGTGKSFKIDDPEKGYGLKDVDESRKFRTTFHPDYDYAQFVGAYKPKKELNNTTNKEELTYSFVPQVFAKAYAAAWKLYLAAGNASTADNQVYLVIEEINRGNCAQIFGDIFQLLDRDGDGFSQYSIDADCDFAEWLKEDSILKTVWSDYETKVGDGKLKLPPNLNILATMNTSDQSLFPMDSAFKRRFDWEYVPISFTDEEENEKEAATYEIEIFDEKGAPCKREGDKPYLWKDFVEKINTKILDITKSEDKQLGEFFIKPDRGNVISNKRFLGKVMFYLWNEVCKDEHENESFFRVKTDSKEEYFTFQDLYKKEKSGYLKQFMDELLK